MTTLRSNPAGARDGQTIRNQCAWTAELRQAIVAALHESGGGHYGGSLSVLDVLWTLYQYTLRTSSACPDDAKRDRLILSKGHAAIALYAVLQRLGYFDEPLGHYARAGSPLEGHPDMTTLPGVDFSTGSLGQGLSVGLGMALALRSSDAQVWVVVGDGECQEGQIWEAAMLAARLRLDRLHVVVDANGYQEYGWPTTNGVPAGPVEQFAHKWNAFGWRVFEVDGHDHQALADCFNATTLTHGAPTVVIAHTIKGKGYATIEADPLRFHCTILTEAERRALGPAE